MGGGESAGPYRHHGLIPTTSVPLRVITHNIRYATTDLFQHERPWAERLPGIVRELYHYAAMPFNPASTVICLQEALLEQVQNLDVTLRTGWGSNAFAGEAASWHYVGVGRDDGKLQGEFNPIFYRPDYWTKEHFETIWLSETPAQVSRGWDGGCNRICTCLVLQRRPSNGNSTGGKVVVLNTHLDNSGIVARRKGAKLIVEHAQRLGARFTPDHMILTGDLNSTVDERGGAWQVLNAKGSGFVDVSRLLDRGKNDKRAFGDSITFTGFDGQGDGDGLGVLDFVHLGLKEDNDLAESRHKLHSYTVVPNLFEDGVRTSDHRAVVVDLLL